MMRFRRLVLAALREQLAGRKARLPDGAAVLWGSFGRLSRARTWHAHGPNPISFQEIEAFCRLTGTPLEPWHVETLAAMDEAWLVHTFEALQQPSKSLQTASPVSSRTLTANLFDAMFG